MSKFNDRTGEIGINCQGLKMWIKEYRGCMDLDVEFENGFISKNKNRDNFKKGQIKNSYHPSVYGVGYIGEGKYQPYINRIRTIQYGSWNHIMERCYDEKYHKKSPTYKGCEICSEWHNFQNFAEWFNENYYTVDEERMHLDKDILQKGNRVYSPHTSIFVPQTINGLFIKQKNARGNYPIGVYCDKNERLIIQIHKNDTTAHLGCSDSPKKAFETYKIEKEKYIKKVAEEYKSKIPQKLYDAMYRYKVEITD